MLTPRPALREADGHPDRDGHPHRRRALRARSVPVVAGRRSPHYSAPSSANPPRRISLTTWACTTPRTTSRVISARRFRTCATASPRSCGTSCASSNCVIFEMTGYFWRKRRRALMVRSLAGEALFAAAVTGLMLVNARATLVVFVVPFVLTRLLMMAGNWGQHAFVDRAAPENCYRSSITCLARPPQLLRGPAGLPSLRRLTCSAHDRPPAGITRRSGARRP